MSTKSRRLPWNWRDKLEIVFSENKNEFKFTLQFKDGEEIEFFEKEVGSLSVEKKQPYFVSVSDVEEYFRGRGQGKRLYLAAINRLGKLSSKYYNASTLAQNVWRSLAKDFYYEIDFWEGTITVYSQNSNSGQKLLT